MVNPMTVKFHSILLLHSTLEPDTEPYIPPKVLTAPYMAVTTHCCKDVCHRVNVKPFKVMLGTITELERRYIFAALLLLPFTMMHHLMVGFLKQQAIRWDTMLLQSSQSQ